MKYILIGLVILINLALAYHDANAEEKKDNHNEYVPDKMDHYQNNEYEMMKRYYEWQLGIEPDKKKEFCSPESDINCYDMDENKA